MTEKRKPTHDLEAFKRGFSAPDKQATRTAHDGAAALGFSTAQIAALVQTIERSHFYKSMTSYKNNKAWQDVYRVPHAGRVICVKFTESPLGGFLLLSFKDKEDG